MNARGEWAILAVLVAAAGGLYASGAFQPSEGEFSEDTSSPEPPAPDPVVLTVPEAGGLAAEPFGTGLIPRGEWRGQATVADLDADGDLDLVASIRRWNPEQTAPGLHVWLGDGEGGFELAVEGIRRDMGYGGADAADIDGDGDLDLAFSAHDTPPQAFLNDGDSTWTEASGGLVSEGVSVDVALGDFDGDDVCDMAVLGMFPSTGGLNVFHGDGEGGWQLREELLDIEEFGNALLTTDITGDGVLELVAATSTGVRVWSRDESGFVDRSAGLEPPFEPADPNAQSYIAGSDLDVLPYDFDGDGVQELLVAGMVYEGHDPLRVFKLDSEGVWRPWGEGLPTDEAIFDVVLAELDGEGPPEIALAGRFGMKILSVPAPGRFAVAGRVAGTEGIVNITAGDFDADGTDEVVFIGFGGIRALKPIL